MQTEDGKWRVEFDEPWAREGAKPPEGRRAGRARGRGRRTRPRRPEPGRGPEAIRRAAARR